MRSKPFTVAHFARWAKTLRLESGEPWKLEPFQRNFVEDVFAGYRECWLLVPEGNGKTTLLAGLGLYGLRFADEPAIPITASTMSQAKILYKQAKGFIRRCQLETPDKDGLWFEAYDGWRRIDLRRVTGKTKRGLTLGSMEVHGADSGNGDGVIPFPYCFLDELHRHRDLDLYEVWRGKLGKRNAQLVTISTAGAPGSDFEETRKTVKGAGEQTSRGRTFVRTVGEGLVLHEHAVPDDGDVADLKLVKEANPFSAITLETLRAKRASPTMSDPHWKRFTCNIAAQLDSAEFIPLVDWVACAGGAGVESGARVCLGADGSRTWDTTVVAWASASEDGFVDVDARVFSVRPEVAHHVLHSGGKIDFGDVEGFVVDCFDTWEVVEAAYDPRYLERSMEIVQVRLPEACVFAIEPSSKAMRDALQELYRLVAERKLRHRGDPVLAAHVANATVDRGYSSEIRRVRKANQQKPIDAVPAMALAVWRAANTSAGSVYESRGLAFA